MNPKLAGPMLLVFICMSSHHARSADRQRVDCSSLDRCVASLRQLADSGRKFGSQSSAESIQIANDIHSHEGAVEALVPLLADPDLEVANLAAIALRDAPSIPPRFLPEIRVGLDRKLGWLAPALGRIDTAEAAEEAVARYIVSSGAPHNQEAYAVELSGERAIPYIVKSAACATPCERLPHYLLAELLREMGPERASAADGLMQILEDTRSSLEVAMGVLAMIQALGADGRTLEPRLMEARKNLPHLGPWIDDALIGIGSEASGAIFAQRLTQSSDEPLLSLIASTGYAARAAGPAVVEVIENDPGLRAAAAYALGWIGYDAAVPVLVSTLDDPVDVRAAWMAAVSLGRLEAEAAVDALNVTRDSHWYPPVRVAARAALAQIRGDESPPASDEAYRSFFGLMPFEHIVEGVPECTTITEVRIREPRDSKLSTEQSSRRLKRLAYDSEVVSYGAADEAQQKAEGAEVIEVHAGNLQEHRESIRQIPSVALRVEDGWLAGANRGEWGGELMFIADDGRQQHVLDTNVEDIYRLGSRVVATTGLVHLGVNRGVVFEIERDAEGTWSGKEWRVLPGAPRSSFLVSDGLMIDTVRGGAIVLRPDGSMRMAACAAGMNREVH